MPVICGNCLEVLKTFDSDSVDSIVTDPPAGIAFMGKEWDKDKGGRDQWIAWMQEVSTECLRVIKPGGHALVWSIPRTSHWTAMAWENAGWEVRDKVVHIFGSGFPKSLDISKAIDKAAPRAPLYAPFAEHYAERRKAAGLTHAQICDLVGAHGEINHGGASVNWEKGYGVPTIEQWEKLIPILNPSGDWLALIKRVEAEREVIGKTKGSKLAIAPGQNNDRGGIILNTTLPATDAAKQWNGWGTALKPAHEDWLLFRRPVEGTIAQNVLKYGVGGINIDGCRVQTQEDDKWYNSNYPHKTTGYDASGYKIDYQRESMSNDKGRFPANLIHDGSDEVLKIFPDSLGQRAAVTGNEPTANGFSGAVKFSGMRKRIASAKPRGDSGSAARFFYCAKASPSERNAGCENLPDCTAGECTNRKEGSAGLNSPRAGAGRTNGAKNNHPTVKALALCRYLVKLITPPEGIVLDPFCGSGSIGVAALEEGFSCIMIDNDPNSVEISKARLRWVGGRG